MIALYWRAVSLHAHVAGGGASVLSCASRVHGRAQHIGGAVAGRCSCWSPVEAVLGSCDLPMLRPPPAHGPHVHVTDCRAECCALYISCVEREGPERRGPRRVSLWS